MPHAPWMPTSSLSTYHWNIIGQFSKIVNSNHFYSPCSYFKSQKMNSYAVSSTCRWPIYVVIPKTVCLEFMLAMAHQYWAFWFLFFTCKDSRMKQYSFWLTCLSKIINLYLEHSKILTKNQIYVKRLPGILGFLAVLYCVYAFSDCGSYSTSM